MATYEAVVIGTSLGGLHAIQQVLSPLPADFALAILLVQHRMSDPEEAFVPLLQEWCTLTVKEGEDKESIRRGIVYLAPADYHLQVEREKTLSLSIDAKVNYSRPSIDVLFETAADAYQSRLIGILLTGASRDGTAGLKKIKEQGGLTIAQKPDTALSDIMPRSAIQAKIVDKILSLAEIARFLASFSAKGM